MMFCASYFKDIYGKVYNLKHERNEGNYAGLELHGVREDSVSINLDKSVQLSEDSMGIVFEESTSDN